MMGTVEIVPPSLVQIEEAVMVWLNRFAQEQWSGSLTLHFNRGIVQSYEPKPNLRIVK